MKISPDSVARGALAFFLFAVLILLAVTGLKWFLIANGTIDFPE